MSTKLSQFEAEVLKLKVNSETREKGYGINTLAEMWKQGLDLEGATPERPNKPYTQSTWVYACVNEIIKACRGIQMMISTVNDDVIESGPGYDLLFNNEKITFTKFLTDTVGYLALLRECYWVFLDKNNRVPESVLVAGPNSLIPEIHNEVLVGYWLKVGINRWPLFIDDVHPLIDFNPDDNFHGAGPAMVGKIAISSAYQASLLNEATLANGGKIGNLITIPGRLEPDERQMLISQFESRHKGARNAGKTCLMTGGADVKNLAQTMAELEMIELRKMDASEICITFGVPPEVIGLNSEAQYAHGPAQQRFISTTINSILSFVAENISLGILNRFKYRKHLAVDFSKSKSYSGRAKKPCWMPSYRTAKIKAVNVNQDLFAWFVVEEHPAMQAMLRERIEKVIGYTERGVTLNACIDAFDLPFEHFPWGDDWWVSAGLIPARYTLEAGLEGLTGPSLPEGEGEEPGKFLVIEKMAEDTIEKADEQQRLRLWRNWATSWLGIEREYTQAIRTLFVRQQRDLTTKLRKAMPKSKSQKADTNEVIARVVFDLKKEDGKLKVINHTFFQKASELGIRQSLTELLGLKAEQLKEKAEQVKRLPALKGKLVISTSNISGVNKVTQRQVASQLKLGLDAGEGLNDLTKRIQTVLGSNRARALRIARTQTGGAVSSGRHFGMKAAGVELKTWLTSGDLEVRDAHKTASEKYAEGITLDLPFMVDNEPLMYPGDPSGSAANIINCRCLELAKRAAGKTFDMEFYVTLRFYSYGDMVRDKAA